MPAEFGVLGAPSAAGKRRVLELDGIRGTAILLSEGGRTQTMFRHPLLVWLGTVSYGIYLLDQPVSGAMHGFLRHQSPRIAVPSDALVTALALVCTLLLATVSARYFERPFILAGQRVRYQA